MAYLKAILFCALFTLMAYNIYGQHSPVKFVNSTCTIHIDTSYGNTLDYKYFINLKYKFINTGDSLLKFDSLYLGHINVEPKDTGIISLYLDNFKKREVGFERRFLTDTSLYINIAFRYKGKIYSEKLTCKVTFGRSKLIDHENPVKLLNDSVAKFVVTDESDTSHFRISCIMFKTYYTVKNTTKKPIWCTKRLVAWNDAGIDNYRELVNVPPNATYKIPVQVNMDQKFQFTKYGYFLVCSEDIYEAHTICIKSTLDPKGDYIYKR